MLASWPATLSESLAADRPPEARAGAVQELLQNLELASILSRSRVNRAVLHRFGLLSTLGALLHVLATRINTLGTVAAVGGAAAAVIDQLGMLQPVLRLLGSVLLSFSEGEFPVVCLVRSRKRAMPPPFLLRLPPSAYIRVAGSSHVISSCLYRDRCRRWRRACARGVPDLQTYAC